MDDKEKQGQSSSAPGGDDPGAPQGIDDDQLPEDLRPTDDNPLAQPLDPEDDATKDPEELDLHGGKPAEEWGSDLDGSADDDGSTDDDASDAGS